MIGFGAEDNEPIKEIFGDLWKFSQCRVVDYGTFSLSLQAGKTS